MVAHLPQVQLWQRQPSASRVPHGAPDCGCLDVVLLCAGVDDARVLAFLVLVLASSTGCLSVLVPTGLKDAIARGSTATVA